MRPGLGEFGRIRRFFAPLAGPGGLDLTDDAALIDCAADRQLVATMDTIVAGVHYLPDDPPDLIARKLLRVNLSDLAAMGARPRFYLLSTALPATIDDSWVARFAEGLEDDQRRFGVRLLGGDSVQTSGPAVLTITALGELAVGSAMRRNGARPGDTVWVSGTLGDAHLGLAVLRGGYPDLPFRHRAVLATRYQLPEPRVELGPRLIGLAHAMADVSDGLLADLGHICAVSGVAGRIEVASLPLSPAAQAVASLDPAIIPQLAAGGDDYELLFTAPANARETIEALSAILAVPLSPVGTIQSGEGVTLVDQHGAVMPMESAGYRHF